MKLNLFFFTRETWSVTLQQQHKMKSTEEQRYEEDFDLEWGWELIAGRTTRLLISKKTPPKRQRLFASRNDVTSQKT
jgi:hypothetical protein